MKLLAAATLLGAVMPTALGCLKVHTWLQSNPLANDAIGIQIFDNDEEVCFDTTSEFFADNEDHFRVECGRYGAEIWGNGRYGKVWNSSQFPICFCLG